jgi:hypothetical protein
MIVLRLMGWLFLIIGLVILSLMLSSDVQYAVSGHAAGCGFLHGRCLPGQRANLYTGTFVGALFAFIGWVFRAIDKAMTNAAQHREHLLHFGTQGQATITDVQDTGVTINNSPRLRVTARIEAQGEAPFEVTKAMLFSRVAFPRIGEVWSVRFDPNNHQDFTFAPTQSFVTAPDATSVPAQLNPTKTASAAISLRFALGEPALKDRLRQAHNADEAREILRSMLGAQVDAMKIDFQSKDSTAGASAAPSAMDIVGQLERLTILRDKGALTPEEFETEKRKILGES